MQLTGLGGGGGVRDGDGGVTNILAENRSLDPGGLARGRKKNVI